MRAYSRAHETGARSRHWSKVVLRTYDGLLCRAAGKRGADAPGDMATRPAATSGAISARSAYGCNGPDHTARGWPASFKDSAWRRMPHGWWRPCLSLRCRDPHLGHWSVSRIAAARSTSLAPTVSVAPLAVAAGSCAATVSSSPVPGSTSSRSAGELGTPRCRVHVDSQTRPAVASAAALSPAGGAGR